MSIPREGTTCRAGRRGALGALLVAGWLCGTGCAGTVEASEARAGDAIRAGDAAASDDALGADETSSVSDAALTQAEASARNEPQPVDPAVRAAAAAVAPWPDDAPPIAKGLYAGSWTVDAAHPFEYPWIDEAALRETYTKRAAGRRMWAGMATQSAFAPLDALVRDRTGPASMYYYTLVARSPDEGADPHDPASYETLEGVLHVRHRGRLRAYYDGQLVIDALAPPPGEVGHARAPVTLTGAFDVLLLKVARGSPELGDSFAVDARLGLPDGSVIPRQAWNTMRPSGFLSDLRPVDEASSESDG